VTAFNVQGGDPTTDSDTLIVTATSGNDTIGYNRRARWERAV